MKLQVSLLFAVVVSCCAQRSPYAKNPVGYPSIVPPTTTMQVGEELGNRFGDGDLQIQTSSTTTERLPVEALGDRDLVNRISKWPVDQQPFWYLNWKALEEYRKAPKNYPQKGNDFTSRVLTML